MCKRDRGRPHWGKVHYLEGAALADLYPKWREWWQMRDMFDPKQRFLNDFLRAVRPS
jgi:FAD/FMN-containing dehydrogenase